MDYWTTIHKYSLDEACQMLLNGAGWKESSVQKWRSISGISPLARKIMKQFSTRLWNPYTPQGGFNNYEYLVLLKLVWLQWIECKWGYIGDNRRRLLFKQTNNGNRSFFIPNMKIDPKHPNYEYWQMKIENGEIPTLQSLTPKH